MLGPRLGPSYWNGSFADGPESADGLLLAVQEFLPQTTRRSKYRLAAEQGH